MPITTEDVGRWAGVATLLVFKLVIALVFAGVVMSIFASSTNPKDWTEITRLVGFLSVVFILHEK